MQNHVSTGDKCQITECTAACTSSPPLVMGGYCSRKALTSISVLQNKFMEEVAEHRSGTLILCLRQVEVK